MLPEILSEFEHVVLSVVYDEIKSIQDQLYNQIYFLKNISLEKFEPQDQMKKEFRFVMKCCKKILMENK